MKTQDIIIPAKMGIEKSAVYYSLIALWVFSEAMLGGIIHGFRIPVSGLVVGSCAITCICLIAWYSPGRGSILKATIVVAVFKMMLSPQAPPPAYIAVFFQGLLGELLFFQKRSYALSCILLAVLGLLESGLQRILMLTIVYGNDFWNALNTFINGLTRQKNITNYSWWIAAGYTSLHAITGFAVGWWVSRLPLKIEQWKEKGGYFIPITKPVDLPHSTGKKRGRKKIWLITIWLLLVCLYVQSYFKIGNPVLPSHISLKILLRSVIIVLGWVFIISPVLTRLLHAWLKKRQLRSQQEIKEVLQLLPVTRSLIRLSWKHAAKEKGLKRVSLFVKILLVNSLYSPVPSRCEVYILSGAIQSGKTTALRQWTEQATNVFGILTPVEQGKRVFMDIQTGKLFDMEAKDGEAGIPIGRFVFSPQAFERAKEIIRAGIGKSGWLVIDEVGPLELRGEGFSDVVREVLENRNGKLILVVRNGLTAEVKDKFGITDFTTINSLDVMTQTPC